jgi:chromosome segregation ATPase
MTMPDLGRKVRQLDNDVQAIYEMIAGIAGTQTRQGNRLEEIAAEQAVHRGKLEEITAELGVHRGKLEEITAEQATHRGKLEEITAEQATHRGKLEEILDLLRNGRRVDGMNTAAASGQENIQPRN